MSLRTAKTGVPAASRTGAPRPGDPLGAPGRAPTSDVFPGAARGLGAWARRRGGHRSPAPSEWPRAGGGDPVTSRSAPKPGYPQRAPFPPPRRCYLRSQASPLVVRSFASRLVAPTLLHPRLARPGPISRASPAQEEARVLRRSE
nr:translation initiation factor IF-2-like [Pongo pygmaeus]